MTLPSIAAAQAALARARAQQASDTYRQTQTQTISPGQLLIMLYEGALRFLSEAKTAMQEHNIERSHLLLLRAQDILAELDATLDDSAGAIAVHLHDVYNYCFRKLVQANIEKKTEYIDEVSAFLNELLESWRQAVIVTQPPNTPGIVDGIAFHGNSRL